MNKIKRARKISVVIVLSLLVGMMFTNGTTFADEGLKFSHRDEFNSFDNTFWTVEDKYGPALDMMSVSDGIIKVTATETDNYPTLISKGIPIEMGDKLIIKRRTYAHAEHDKFAPGAYVTEETNDSWNFDRDRDFNVLLFFQHLYFTYDVGRYPENLTKGNFGYTRLDSFTKPNELNKENYGITRSTLDEWVEEEFVYDTVTGDVTITSGGETMNFKGRPLEHSYVRFQMSPYGWYTGQYDQMDWIDFKVMGPNAEGAIEDNSIVNNANAGQVFYMRDDFNGSSLNSDSWYVYDSGGAAYDRVSLSSGELTLPCDITDDPPILMSKGLSIQKGDIFKIKRRTFAHAASDTYRPWTLIQEVNTDTFTTDPNSSANMYSFQHLNFTYDKGRYPESVTQANLGMHALPGQDLSTLSSDKYGILPLTLDKWVEEELVYDTNTGQVTITSDGNTTQFMSKPLEKQYVRYLMNPYGWGTGHYDKLDWVEFTIERPGEVNSVITTGDGILKGTVLSYDTSSPMAGVSVALSQLGKPLFSATTDANGEYSFTVSTGTYDLSLTKAGYIGADYKNIESVAKETTYIETIIQVPQSTSTGTATGEILNAVTGQVEPNVQVEVRKGLNNQSGTPELVITANDNGMYLYKGAAGYYTFTAKKEGFSNKVFSTSIKGDTESRLADVAISPHLQSDQIRVVLRWSDNPRDLDSHISGPSGDGAGVHVYFDAPSASSGNNTVILDVDDTDGEGPETITLTKPLSGQYTYSVHDYTNRYVLNSNALAESMATVEVYVGNTPAKVFNVPNLNGNLWKVFTYDGVTVQPVNSMTDHEEQTTIR